MPPPLQDHRLMPFRETIVVYCVISIQPTEFQKVMLVLNTCLRLYDLYEHAADF
jgi:hypothetical protein